MLKYLSSIIFGSVLLSMAIIRSEPTGKASFFLLLILAVFALVNFPGYVVYRILARSRPLPWIVVFCLSSVFGLAIIQLLCIVSLSLQVPNETAISILLAATFLAIVVADFSSVAKSPFGNPSRCIVSRLRGWDVSVIILWIICGIAAYIVGHWGEPKSLLGEARTDIASAYLLQYINDYHKVSPIAELSPVYPFPGTYYLFALISDLSGIDPNFVVDKSRYFWTLLATASIYFATYGLTKSRAIASFSFCLCAVFALLGQFAQVPGLYWGQLVPVAHRGDIAMDVIVPLSIGAIIGLIRGRSRNLVVYATCLFATQFILLFIHQREYVQVLIYLALVLVTITFVAKKIDRRMLALVLAFVVMGVAYKYWYLANAPSIATVTSIARNMLIEEFFNLSSLGGLDIARKYVINYGLYANGIWFLNLILTFVALIAYRHEIRIQAIFIIIVFFIIISSLAVLSYPFLIISFDEMLYGPVRHVIYFLYILFPLALIHIFMALRIRTPGLISFVTRRAYLIAVMLLISIAGFILAYGISVSDFRQFWVQHMPFVKRAVKVLAVLLVMGFSAYAFLRLDDRRSVLPRSMDVWKARMSAIMGWFVSGAKALQRSGQIIGNGPRRNYAETAVAVILFSLGLYLLGRANALAAPVLADSPYVLRGALFVLVSTGLFGYLIKRKGRDSAIRPFAFEEKSSRAFLLLIFIFAIPLAVTTRVPNSAIIKTMFENPGPAVPELTVEKYYQQYSNLYGSDVKADGCKEITVNLLQSEFRTVGCMPPFDFIQWTRSNLRPDAIALYNPVGLFDPTGFLQQRLAAPIHPNNYRNWEKVFTKFAQLFNEDGQYHPIPYYSDSYDSEKDRLKAAVFLGATHVIIDPGNYGWLMPKIKRDLMTGYKILYDRNHWAVLALL
jgi:hypothetical protein